MANRVAPAFRFCLDNSTLIQATPIRYLFLLTVTHHCKPYRNNIAFVSKPSNLPDPHGGDIAYTAGFLAIDRENDREALKTILQAADYLKRGICSMGIFPEGTRTRTGKLGDFHAGSFKIAQRAGVPLVIACVRDTEKASRRLFLRPTKVYLDILEVLPAEQVKAMSTRDLAAIARCCGGGN